MLFPFFSRSKLTCFPFVAHLPTATSTSTLSFSRSVLPSLHTLPPLPPLPLASSSMSPSPSTVRQNLPLGRTRALARQGVAGNRCGDSDACACCTFRSLTSEGGKRERKSGVRQVLTLRYGNRTPSSAWTTFAVRLSCSSTPSLLPPRTDPLENRTGWTLRGAIQPSIPIYLTQETFTEVSKAFPYLTNAGKAVRSLFPPCPLAPSPSHLMVMLMLIGYVRAHRRVEVTFPLSPGRFSTRTSRSRSAESRLCRSLVRFFSLQSTSDQRLLTG